MFTGARGGKNFKVTLLKKVDIVTYPHQEMGGFFKKVNPKLEKCPFFNVTSAIVN